MSRPISRFVSTTLLALCLPMFGVSDARAQLDGPEPIELVVSERSQRLEMIANSSRILSVADKIPRAQVSNPEILELTPLSPTQVQVFAKKAGVTQVNLWNENNEVRSIDVIVFGDARELTVLLQSEFPAASLRVKPLPNSVIVSGYVDRPEEVSRVIRIAEDFYPKVINNISVGGVQQVLLHVKVMEVSRTKLRAMGFDWSITNGADFLVSSVSGLLSPGGAATGGDTVRFGIVDSNVNFLGVLEALRQNSIAKILAEPTLVTVSGRPAKFTVGGEFPILVPAGLGTVSIEYKTFGTVVDFVPIVLGNGRIRLEVRPRVSELDDSRGVTLNNQNVPALNVREVDTGVELNAGQTLALAGLVQNRTEAVNRGIPIISDLPYIGVPFRRVEERNNEIELLIMVTPELVDAMDPHEVPPIGPGMHTVSPPDGDVYWRGHLEVPNPRLPPGYQNGQPGQGYPGNHPQYDQMPPQPSPGPGVPAEQIQSGPQASYRGQHPTGQFATSDPRSSVTPAQWTTTNQNLQNRARPSARPTPGPSSDNVGSAPEFIGRVGYDVQE
ncbi:MAG: pilus assembly protein N-terminal domain-containing protein [Pirellulales bacterium]